MGHMLADERDRPTFRLEELHRAVIDLAEAPPVFGIRRRFLALLQNNVNERIDEKQDIWAVPIHRLF